MSNPLTRREAITRAALAAGALLVGCDSQKRPEPEMNTPTHSRMPVVFLPHGGGPWPFIPESTLGAAGTWDQMRAYMNALNMVVPEKPAAILVVSAHWEAPKPTVQTASRPPLLYDYYGFPDEAYEVEWPAPGAPDVAREITAKLENAGFQTMNDPARGFDHGVFVPLKLAYPGADVPTLQLSLVEGLDPAKHVEMGRAIASLRDEGVFIVGSGMSFHNMRAFMRHARGGAPMLDESKAFDEWIAETADLAPTQRESRLVAWDQAPAARDCHPREEHLLPLMVCAGAAEDSKASMPYRDIVMGAHVSAVHFG